MLNVRKYSIIRVGRLLTKAHSKGGTYSKGGAYCKGDKSNYYGMFHSKITSSLSLRAFHSFNVSPKSLAVHQYDNLKFKFNILIT